MRILFTFLTAFCLAAFFSPWSHAETGEPVHCGDPDPAELRADPGDDFCDIYARKFAYRGEDIKFYHMLKERRENYNAPREAAWQAYKQQIESGQASANSEP